MKKSFDDAFNFVIGVEGGYSNDPRDRGGETKYGISKRAHPDVDIAQLTLDQAKDIYRSDYWDACKCESLDYVLALPLFDSAVNQGVDRACKLLQKTLKVPEDGVIGPATIGAANRLSQRDMLANFLSERALHYASLPTFSTYGRGWMRRLFQTSKEALT
jgi:lysozyme family protein